MADEGTQKRCGGSPGNPRPECICGAPGCPLCVLFCPGCPDCQPPTPQVCPDCGSDDPKMIRMGCLHGFHQPAPDQEGEIELAAGQVGYEESMKKFGHGFGWVMLNEDTRVWGCLRHGTRSLEAGPILEGDVGSEVCSECEPAPAAADPESVQPDQKERHMDTLPAAEQGEGVGGVVVESVWRYKDEPYVPASKLDAAIARAEKAEAKLRGQS